MIKSGHQFKYSEKMSSESSENLGLKVQTASNSNSSGHKYVAVVFVLFLFSCFYPFTTKESQFVGVLACALLCSALAVIKKTSIRPTTTYILALHSVVLNTIAFGCVLSESFPLFVATSSLTSALLSFLALPMKIQRT